MEIKRGFVYWVNLGDTRGSEIRKRRPAVVMGANPINRARKTVVVIPLSSAGKKRPPITVSVSCLGKEATAVIDQIRAIDKSRFDEECEKLSEENMNDIERGLRLVIGL